MIMKKRVYYPEDKDYLLEIEPLVTHFDVLEMPEYLEKTGVSH